MSRIIFSAVMAVAAFGASVDAFAADHHYKGSRRHYSRYGQSHEFYLNEYSHRPVGGHLYGWQLTPYVFGSAAYNYPGFYNNHTFWERVQTQGNYPVQY